MSTKRRFVCTGLSWSGGRICIPRDGFETDDEQIIDFITHHADFNNFIFEVPTKDSLTEQSKEYARTILREEQAEFEAKVEAEVAKRLATLEIQPLSVPNPEEEVKKLAEEQEIRQKQAEEETKAAEERKAKNKATSEKIKQKSEKKKAAAGKKKG